MSSLSCAKRSASGPGCTAHTGVDQRAQHVLRHVLVVEGDHVDSRAKASTVAASR